MPASRRDAYHVAEAVQDYLFSKGGFQYETDLRGMCDGDKLVDCFLTNKRGFCVYFASAMVMLLRELDVPARYVAGYLPGQQQSDGSWRVDGGAAHAWVEVYFPHNGWVEFDPTPGNGVNGQAPTHLAPGDPVAVATPGSGQGGFGRPECVVPGEAGCDEPATVVPPDAPPPATGPSPALTIGLLIGAAALLMLLIGFFAYRRVPANEPASAFNSLSRLATRLGYGPRPAQTTYEYADRLSELVPVARADLHLIATAKVEIALRRASDDRFRSQLDRGGLPPRPVRAPATRAPTPKGPRCAASR